MIRADPDARFVYDLALSLSKSAGEVLDLPAEEIAGWAAYFRERERENKKGGRRHGLA